MKISVTVSRHGYPRQRSLTDSDAVVTAQRAPLPPPPSSEGLTIAQPPCQPQQGTQYAHMHVVTYGGLLPTTQGAAPPSCLPDNTHSLLGVNTVIISVAFIVSAAAIVCAANKWYEYLFFYSSPILEEYRERQALREEREQAQRRATAAAAAEEEAAHRRLVEELYSSIASTSYDYANLLYGSKSSASSPEIHPASPSSSSSFGSPSREHHGTLVVTC